MKHRVCLVTNYLSAGGLERVLTRLATYFVEKKEVQVTIVTLFNTQCFYSLSDKVEGRMSLPYAINVVLGLYSL